MAWLVALNEGLFDQADPDAIPALLQCLALNVRQSELSLDDDHPGWPEAVSAWIALEVQAGHNKRLTGSGAGNALSVAGLASSETSRALERATDALCPASPRSSLFVFGDQICTKNLRSSLSCLTGDPRPIFLWREIS